MTRKYKGESKECSSIEKTQNRLLMNNQIEQDKKYIRTENVPGDLIMKLIIDAFLLYK